MKIEKVQELRPYLFSEITNFLNLNEENTKKVINALLNMNIIRNISSNVSKQELEELFEIENLQDINRSEEIYVFRYVGMIMISNVCFFVYPKYIKNISDDKKSEKFKQILEVIRKYKSREQIQDVSGEENIGNFNLLSFTLDLIEDYHENGLYENNKQIVEENGFGEILWEKTINENTAYYNNGNFIYLNMYTNNNILNEDNIFRELHKCILSRSSEKIKDILNILDEIPINLSNLNIDDFGNKDYLIYRIEQELSQQFITSKQKILHRMLDYIKRNENFNTLGEICFVGTTSFNLIWEEVCSCALGNDLNKTLEELELSCCDNTKLNKTIPKPIWKPIGSTSEHSAKNTLIPDIVVIKEGKISIYDAKYYKIQLDENGVKNQPGVGDVTKQYLYELCYRNLAKENNLEFVKNAFVMPCDSKEGSKKIGIARMEIFPNTYKDIEIILHSASEYFDKYLKF